MSSSGNFVDVPDSRGALTSSKVLLFILIFFVSGDAKYLRPSREKNNNDLIRGNVTVVRECV